MWAVVRNEDIIHHPSNIIHLETHHPSNIFHLTDCEELVRVLVHRCKKLDENGTEK